MVDASRLPDWHRARVLKGDLFSLVESGRWGQHGPGLLVRRDISYARRWTWPIAWVLARNEARALRVLAGQHSVPQLVLWRRGILLRSWIEGRPLAEGPPEDVVWFREAWRLLRQLHRAGVCHNDLAKPQNWLVSDAGAPAVIDFQLATIHRRRTRLFRLLAREDLRHLLKHKQRWFPDHMTARERAIVANRSVPSQLWLRYWKPAAVSARRRRVHCPQRRPAL
jgi:RIO-like serine/threonine protein kinase